MKTNWTEFLKAFAPWIALGAVTWYLLWKLFDGLYAHLGPALK